jgi:catechol 2,3-dioxygenase-like lactoylglutathione lyase family enzyme
MRDLTAIEIKAFVPAKNFDLSKKFYRDLGFTVTWSSDGLAYIRHGNASFLLQAFPDGIDNFMMHLLVQNVDAWWSHVQDQDIVAKYGVMIEPVSDKPWGLRDFAISDPSHVLWRIGQTIAKE